MVLILISAFLLTLFATLEKIECVTTQLPDVTSTRGRKSSNTGAARQIYGSSALRPFNNLSHQQKQRNQQNQQQQHQQQQQQPQYKKPNSHIEFDYDYYTDRDVNVTHGRIIHDFHGGTQPPIMQPFDASYRAIGGVRVPYSGSGTDFIGSRSSSDRNTDLIMRKSFDRYGNHQTGTGNSRVGVFVPDHTFHRIPEEMFEYSENVGRVGGVDDIDDDYHHYAGDPNPNDYANIIHSTDCNSICVKNEFYCNQTCMCIPQAFRCDRNMDCDDGEDEEDCAVLNEEIKEKCEKNNATHIMCPQTFVCILKDWLCDGDDDCGDYSDETHCGARVNCSYDQFECHNGLCIHQSWVCDGENDCKDESDETNCTKLPCTNQEFQCTDGYCVSASFQCDGDPDCLDASDEISCQTAIPNCPEGEFKCKGSMSSSGGPGSRCILERFHCDGDNDCGDWSDEEGCTHNPSLCTSSEFKCDDGTCIPNKWKCDSEQDCDGGEDEKNCNNKVKTERTCAPDEHTCKNGRCILNSWLCDGIADCRAGEDELNCTTECKIGQHKCYRNTSHIQTCINQKNICDGHFDCRYGDDEKNCPKIKECQPNTKCEHLCITNYQGIDECACRIGHILHSNKYNCTDIDECQPSKDPVCSQICINTHGSFKCACTSGYVLRPDLRTCKAMGGAVRLITANRADIRQVALNNNKYTSIVKGLHNAIAIDYHFEEDFLFWSDVSTDMIKRSYMNGTNIKDIIKWGLESPGGICVDWIHNLLFWTDSGTRRIEVSTFNGQYRSVIVVNDLGKPRAIVVHPGEALLFWTDWGEIPKIEKVYLDGSERQTIINKSIFWPNALTIDYAANRIYWADAKNHAIESANFDGSDRIKILSNHLPHPFALTLFEDLMYWTDWHTKSISSANKITGKGFRSVHEGLHFPMDIHSYHPSRQPPYQNRCEKSNCSHICLPNRLSKRCVCPVGLTLNDDQKTCTNIPDRILLVARKKDIRLRQLNSKAQLSEVDMAIPLEGLKSTVALDWCSKTNFIYWTDVGRGTITRSYLDGSEQEHIIHTNIVYPAGLALDWITDKLYWTDQGTNRIEVASLNDNYRALLIWNGLDKPRDIVVNPNDGILFWSDWGENPMIEVADMDGTNRRTLISTNLKWPNGLAIDQPKNRLYFVDGGTQIMESINFDGTGRKIVLTSGLEHPFGLDIFDNYVFWTDWVTESVQMADKLTGQNRKTIISNISDAMDLRIFHRQRKNFPGNPCRQQNGGCSHLCLLNQHSYSCACPIGIRLTKDNKTCQNEPDNYLLFAHRIDIRQISLDLDYQVDITLPFPPMSNVIALDIDLDTNFVYWSDTVDDVLVKTSIDGRYTEHIISDNLERVDGLAIERITRKLYWVDGERSTIEVSELNGKNREILIWKNCESPRGITLDYMDGIMFWTDWGFSAKIERANMDGEQRFAIVTNNLGWPNAITIDFDEKLFYWADASINTIESCDYQGRFRKVILTDLPHPYGVAVTNQHIYWTDWKSTSLNSVFKIDPSNITIIVNGLEGLMDIKIIETKKSKQEKNVCGKNNGGCSHLCLRNAKGYACRCPIGLKMMEYSNTTCKNLPDNYLLIAMRTGIGRISLDADESFDHILPIDNIYGVIVLDYHYNLSQIFYADVNIDVIKVVDMKNMSDVKTIIKNGLNTPNGIAVDWVANNLYWSDSGTKTIEVARLDGTCRKTILNSDLTDPRSLILYPKRGFIFWSDWGQPPRIERCLMDGSNRKIIINSALGFPTGMAIDYDSRKLYWTDALEDRIEISDFDGNHRSKIINYINHPFGVTIMDAYIYWTDWHSKSVNKALRNTTSPQQLQSSIQKILHNLRGALDIRGVSKNRQPYDTNPCTNSNGGCTHLCLFTGKTRVCACPDTPDKKICKTDPTFFIPFEEVDSIDYVEDKVKNKKKSHRNFGTTEPPIPIHTILTLCVLMLTSFILMAVIAYFFYIKIDRKRENLRENSRQSILTFSNPNYGRSSSATARNSSSNSIVQDTVLMPSVSKPWKSKKYSNDQNDLYEEDDFTTIEIPTLATTTFIISSKTTESRTPSPQPILVPILKNKTIIPSTPILTTTTTTTTTVVYEMSTSSSTSDTIIPPALPPKPSSSVQLSITERRPSNSDSTTHSSPSTPPLPPKPQSTIQQIQTDDY